MGIRELQSRKEAALQEYHRICKECDAEILAIRQQRDPAYARKQEEKLQKGWEGYHDFGRDASPVR